jgi:Mce-associated membrane protein
MLIGSEDAAKVAELDRDAGDSSRPIGPGSSRPALIDAADAGQIHEYTAGRPRRRRWPGVCIAAVAVAIMVVELIALLSARDHVQSLKATEAARTSALGAARTYAVDVASYDYRQLDSDFGTVEDNSTASFRAQFVASAAALKPVLTQYHAVAKARVLAAGLESASADKAVAAVFIDQTVTNTAQKSGPSTDQSRLQITLVRQHGRWLIDQLQLL